MLTNACSSNAYTSLVYGAYASKKACAYKQVLTVFSNLISLNEVISAKNDSTIIFLVVTFSGVATTECSGGKCSP